MLNPTEFMESLQRSFRSWVGFNFWRDSTSLSWTCHLQAFVCKRRNAGEMEFFPVAGELGIAVGDTTVSVPNGVRKTATFQVGYDAIRDARFNLVVDNLAIATDKLLENIFSDAMEAYCEHVQQDCKAKLLEQAVEIEVLQKKLLEYHQQHVDWRPNESIPEDHYA